MSNRQLSPIARDLIRARKFLSNPDNWCAEGTGDGNGVDGHRRCARLALNEHRSTRALVTAARAIFGTDLITQVNKIGHAAVLRMYDHAIQSELDKVQS